MPAFETARQKERRPATWGDVRAELAAGKYRGVDQVNAYGHHSLPPVGLRAIKPDVPKERALREYLEASRADEVAVIRAIGDDIRACPKKLWMLSVVTKQDLWFAEDGAAQRHCRDGEYGELVRALVATKPPVDFRHEFVFASLVISNWDTARGERLKKNTEGYDHSTQVETVRRLF
jgi:hypothetical protein